MFVRYVSIVNLDGVKNIRYSFFLLHDISILFCAAVDKDFRNIQTWQAI